MSDNTNNAKTANPFVTFPAGVMRAAMLSVSKDCGRPVLTAVQVKGKPTDDGRFMSLTVASSDSYRLFAARMTLDDSRFGGIDGEFEWLVVPTGKFGTGDYVRVERVGIGKAAFEATVYGGRSSLPAHARAAAKVDPKAYVMCDEADGTFPNWEKLVPESTSAAAMWTASPKYVTDAYKALSDATGSETVRFDGMHAKDGVGVGGPLLFSAFGNDVTAECVVMPQRGDDVVVGRAAKAGDTVDRKAYDEMCELYRQHALREEELEAEVRRLRESTPDAEDERELRKRFQARNVELVERVEELEAKLADVGDGTDGRVEELEWKLAEYDTEAAEREAHIMTLEARVAELEREATKVVPFSQGGATVVDDGVFLTIGNANGFIVRSGDGSPLLLMTENESSVWFTGATKALRQRVKELLPMLSWSPKRRAWWVGKTA